MRGARYAYLAYTNGLSKRNDKIAKAVHFAIANVDVSHSSHFATYGNIRVDVCILYNGWRCGKPLGPCQCTPVPVALQPRSSRCPHDALTRGTRHGGGYRPRRAQAPVWISHSGGKLMMHSDRGAISHDNTVLASLPPNHSEVVLAGISPNHSEVVLAGISPNHAEMVLTARAR